MTKKPPIISIMLLLLLGTLACLVNTLPFGNQLPTSTATATQPIPTAPPPSPLPPTPTPTPPLDPTATPTIVVSSVSPTPDVNFGDLSPFRQAMLPDFADDVDIVANGGASRYFIEMTFDSSSFDGDDGLHFSAVQRVRYTNNESVSLSEIYFRLFPNLLGGALVVDTVVVDNQNVTPALEAENSALRVPLSGELSPGDRTDITLVYEVTVPAGDQEGYNIFGYSDKTAALATFYPVIAVYDQNGWHTEIPIPYGDLTYLDTSLYQVQLTVPENMVVTASGSLLDSVSNGDGTKTLSLASGPMRDFYVAMRKDYQVLSEIVDGTVVNSYFPPGLEKGGQLALRYAADALRVFNRRFGQYPFAELDIVATSTSAGGIEYPGIVVVSERIYNQEGGFFQHATAHEVAHQWWYSLVGNDQLNEPWLDESLTNYSAIIYWEEVEGQDSAERVLNGFMWGPYNQAKQQDRDKAVMGPVSNFTQEEYSTFVYGKGSLFFNALRQEAGDETYFEIMNTYYTDFKYEIATASDLFKTIEQVTGKKIEPLLESWLQGR